MLGQTWERFKALPALLQAGPVFLVFGGLVDVVYHLSLHTHASANDLIAGYGHYVTLLGMFVTMTGLVAFARKRSRQTRTNTLKGVVR